MLDIRNDKKYHFIWTNRRSEAAKHLVSAW